MKLPEYNITIILSDPDDPETSLKVTLERVPREKVLGTPIPLANTLEMFEQVVEEAQ